MIDDKASQPAPDGIVVIYGIVAVVIIEVKIEVIMNNNNKGFSFWYRYIHVRKMKDEI